MKRDMNIVRQLLLALEKAEPLNQLNLEMPIILQHLDLMIDAGLIDGKPLRNGGSNLVSVSIRKITWQGYDFLEAARNEGRWQKAERTILEKGGALTIDVLKTVLKAALMHDLGLPSS